MNDESDQKIKNKRGWKRALVQGVGINDADYAVEQVINGKRVPCPFYKRWKNMIQRCYSPKYQERKPTYVGCSVDPDWLTFSNFKNWMITQGWEGKQLDKDILIEGNKVYSADTCAFVTSGVNNFLLDCAKTRGSLPLGVSLHQGKYLARCSDDGIQVKLGYYDSLEEAYVAWVAYKTKLAKQLASQQNDPRVAEALLSRFIKLTYE